MTDLPKVSLRAGNSISGAPSTPSLIRLIQTAAGGGQATLDFFSSEAAARKELADLAAQGDAVWTLHDDAAELGLDFLTSGQPAYVANGPTSRLILQTELSPDVLQADAPDYKEAGIATMWMVTSEGPVDVFISTVEKLGPGVTGAALAPAVLTLLGALRTFVTSFFSQVANSAGAAAGEAEAIATEAAETAAAEAEVDGEIIAEEVALSVEFGPLAIVGLVVAAISIVLMILAFGLSKTMTAWIRVFNASPHPLQLSLAYNYNLAVKQQPSNGLLPPPGTAPAPPGVTPTCSVIYRADYLLQNDNSWEGLGAVVQAPPTAGCPGMTFAIDIPSVGANSLAVTPDGAVDPSSYYDNMEGRSTGLSMSASLQDGSFGLMMGTNQNEYESASPLDSSDGFNYEFVVLAQ